jgi:hypothetical protein
MRRKGNRFGVKDFYTLLRNPSLAQWCGKTASYSFVSLAKRLKESKGISLFDECENVIYLVGNTFNVHHSSGDLHG